MDVHFKPELEAKLNELATTTGLGADELVQEVMAEYLDELAEIRRTLDIRYDDVKSGRVQTLDGDEAFARLRSKSADRRSERS